MTAGGMRATRRTVLRSVVAGSLLVPWLRAPGAIAAAGPGRSVEASRAPGPAGLTDTEIVLGMSAAFSGPSRGLGIELYRGAAAYFTHLNRNGGVGGRKVTLRTYDDGYQPDPSVENTMTLMLEDNVFALFGYVGTPTVTRVLPMLKKFQEKQVYLFFPFTGAQPQREPPYGAFAFNLRASYRQETAGLVDNFVRIGRQRIAVFYQADAYGRSGWAGVRRALKNYGEKIAGEATYRRGQMFTGRPSQAGRDTEGSQTGRDHLHRRLRRVRGVSARCGGSRAAGPDRQPFLCRKRESPEADHGRAQRGPEIHHPPGEFAGRSEL